MAEQGERGIIIELRPKALYRVRLHDGRVITANVASALRRVIVRLVENDQVLIQLSQNDPNRGQIIKIAD